MTALADTARRLLMDAPEPTAVQPDRVLVLTNAEQTLIVETIRTLAVPGTPDAADIPWNELARLHDRIAYGDEYVNPVDELARLTLRKRKIETALRHTNGRIAEVDQLVVEELLERGESATKHAATGATLRLARQVWAKVVRADEKPTDEEKAAAAEGLIAAGLGDYVKPGFNTNSVSAYFREQIKTYDADQRDLPEHERVPRTAESFLPPELVGLIELDDTPTISVRA